MTQPRDETRVYAAARKIADHVFEHFSSTPAGPRPWGEDWRGHSIKRYGPRTASGLFLEFSYGVPSALWTPWGRWQFVGSSRKLGPQELEAIMGHLTIRLYQPPVDLEWLGGAVGPVYAVLGVDGEKLPAPVVITEPEQFAEDGAALRTWERLTAAWTEANRTEPTS